MNTVPLSPAPVRFLVLLSVGLMAGGIAVLPGREWAALGFATVLLVTGIAYWLLADASRWVFLFIAAVLLLPPLPLPWGDSGVHPAVAFAGFGLLQGLICVRLWNVRLGFVGAALAGLASALFLSVPWAALYSGISIAAGSAARAALFCLSVYVFYYLAYGPGRTVRASRFTVLLFWAGFGSVCFAVVDFLLQLPAPARFADQHVWLTSGVYRRAQGVFYDASALGSFSSLLLVTIGAIAANGAARDLKLPRVALIAAGIVAFVALICSFSRTAVLNALVSGLALLWLKRDHITLSSRGVWAASAVAASVVGGVVVVYRAFPEFLSAYVAKLQHSVAFFVSEPNVVLSQRLDSWGRLSAFLQHHSWQSVLGIGYKTLPYTEYLGTPVIADNMYLSLLIETGWPGLAALLLLNAAILSTAYRNTRSTDAAVGLCATIVFCFWCGEMLQMLTGDVLTQWRILPPVFGLLSFGVRDDGTVPRPVQ